MKDGVVERSTASVPVRRIESRPRASSLPEQREIAIGHPQTDMVENDINHNS